MVLHDILVSTYIDLFTCVVFDQKFFLLLSFIVQRNTNYLQCMILCSIWRGIILSIGLNETTTKISIMNKKLSF